MKSFIVNLLIILGCFFLLWKNNIGVSGGDMAIWVETFMVAVAQAVVVGIVAWVAKKQEILYGITGVILGLVISFLLFQFYVLP